MPRIILDTGPLLDLLLYRFWSEQGRSIDENRLTCWKQFNVSPEQIARFLGRYQSIVVVPGVFVEEERVPILTHDQPLYGRCRRQQISGILTSELWDRLY